MKGFTELVSDLRRHYDASLIFPLETHVSGLKAKRRENRTGFKLNFILDSQGQSGGIWCLWNPEIWTTEILENYRQYIHLKVT